MNAIQDCGIAIYITDAHITTGHGTYRSVHYDTIIPHASSSGDRLVSNDADLTKEKLEELLRAIEGLATPFGGTKVNIICNDDTIVTYLCDYRSPDVNPEYIPLIDKIHKALAKKGLKTTREHCHYRFFLSDIVKQSAWEYLANEVVYFENRGGAYVN